MNRRSFLGMLAGVIIAPALGAQTPEEAIVEQLQRQGYSRISLTRTLLGRSRIVATGTPGRREIVINPSNGVVLRDYFQAGSRTGGTSGTGSGSSSTSGPAQTNVQRDADDENDGGRGRGRGRGRGGDSDDGSDSSGGQGRGRGRGGDDDGDDDGGDDADD